jgi:arginase family enzyme
MKNIILFPIENGLNKTKGTKLFINEVEKEFKEKTFFPKIDFQDLNKAIKKVFREAKRQIKKNKKSIFIGGDHSLSYPTTLAFLKTQKKPYLIIFDAHPDLMPEMKEPTHEEWLRAIILKGFNPKNILLLGTRNKDPEEKKFIEKNKIKIKNKKQEILKEIKKIPKNCQIYLSIDIDTIDPKFAPATGYPEKKGISKKDFFEILKEIIKLKPKAIDLVEINPLLDKKNKTIKLGIEIIKEVLKD